VHYPPKNSDEKLSPSFMDAMNTHDLSDIESPSSHSHEPIINIMKSSTPQSNELLHAHNNALTVPIETKWPTPTEKQTISQSSSDTTLSYSNNRPSLHPTLIPQSSLKESPDQSLSPSRMPTGFSRLLASTTRPVSNQSVPTNKPSVYISENPTTMTPTIKSLKVSEDMIEIVLRNFPGLRDADKFRIWQKVTSKHIDDYWNSQPHSPIQILDVETRLIREEIVILPSQRNRWLQEAESVNLLKLYYRQVITFGFLTKHSRLVNNTHSIFLEPFERSEAVYTNNLIIDLGLGPDVSDIWLVQATILDGGIPYPTLAPSNAVPIDPDDSSGLSLVTVILIVILLLFAVMGSLFLFLYLRKRQYEHDMAWKADKARPIEVVDCFVLEEGDRADLIVDQARGMSLRDLPQIALDENHDNDMEYDIDQSEIPISELPQEEEDEDDPTLHYISESQRSPDSAMIQRNVSMLDDESDDENGADIPPLSLRRSSSCGSSVFDPPSLSGFQVTIMDLEN
jgi:hypothetical protein